MLLIALAVVVRIQIDDIEKAQGLNNEDDEPIGVSDREDVQAHEMSPTIRYAASPQMDRRTIVSDGT